MSSQFEKIVVNTNSIYSHQRLPEARHDRFDFIARGDICVGQLWSGVNRAFPLALSLLRIADVSHSDPAINSALQVACGNDYLSNSLGCQDATERKQSCF